MKRNIKHTVNCTRLRSYVILLAALLTTTVFADDVSDAESALMARTKANAPTWQETDPNPADPSKTPYLDNRRALVGYNCQINRVITTVGVGAWTSSLTNMVDDDLDNTATFPAVVGANIAASPIVGIRDLDNYYAPGTTAGFCIVASGGTKVLSLNVIKTMQIWLYCDGKRVEDLTVREGNSGSGVKLQLFAVGNDDACVNLTVKSTKKFDELVLVQGGGLDADVGGSLMVKYAFVGDSHDIYLTTNGVADYCTQTGHPQMSVSCDAFMPSPLVGGIPIPMADISEQKVIDDDLTNTIALVSAVQLASVAFKGRVRVNVTNNDASVSDLFHAGDQVGFKFNVVEVVNLLSLGAWIDIKLYDHNGNDVQTTTVSAEGLALSLASGGDQTSYIVAEKDFSGAEITFYTALGVLDVGSGFGVYYGFVRPKPSVEKHHCPINASYSVNICDQQSTYQLLSNNEVTVTWTLISKPEGSAATVTEDGYVQNMDMAGDYTFRATALDGCHEDVTLHHGLSASEHQCEVPVTTTDYELSTSIYESSGALVSWSDIENSENIVDGDMNTYATYTGGLSLGDNLMIVGVKKKDHTEIFDGSLADQKPVRVGFVVEEEDTYLDLNAINLYNIRCFNDGREVYGRALTDVGVVNVGVGGGGHSKKVRYVIEVPTVDRNGNPIVFDEFQLWKSGIINIQASTMYIYYPFTEEVDDTNSGVGCGNAIMEGSNIVNYADDHAYVSAENIGAVAVGDVIDNLSNIIDYDEHLETCATIVKGAGSGQTVISVKLGHVQDYRQQVGVVVDNSQYVEVDLGSVFKISTYLNGEATGEEQHTWNAIGVNSISSDHKTVLLLTPTKEYDEIRIAITNGLTVAETNKIYGIILRNDIDHDGISDIRDTESCQQTVDNMQASKVCLGEAITFTGTAMTGTDYWIELEDQRTATVTSAEGIEPVEYSYSYTDVDAASQDATTGRIKATSTQDGELTFTLTTIKAGNKMRAYIYDGSGQRVGTAYYTVHPTRTTWKLDAENADWNNWNNWTDGSPYLCTDVVVPANANLYPSLDETIESGNEDKYGCDRIYFENRAAVEKVFKLNYSQAWVELMLQPNRYYLLTAPLQNMYTGDMFIAKQGTAATSPDYFQALTGDSYQQNRFEPRVYQRLWERAADVRLANGEMQVGGAEIMETRWSRRFNALSYAYGKGEGFSAWADPDGAEANAFTFRFPKEHTAYNYFNEVTHAQTNIQETDLLRNKGYRFAYEDGLTPVSYTYRSANDRQVYSGATTITVTASAAAPTRTFLIGNPFMSHVDVAAFLEANSDVVSAVKTYDGNTTTSATAVAGTYITTDENFTAIMPMEAFYVVAKADATTLDVTFSENMFGNAVEAEPNPAKRYLSRRANGNDNLNGLKITASRDDLKASAICLDGNTNGRSEVLFDDEVKPQLAIFGLADGKALDICPIDGSKAYIPLGICIQQEGDVTLNFRQLGDFNIDDYELVDSETEQRCSLDQPVTLHLTGSTLGRFLLRNKNATDIKNVNGNNNYNATVYGLQVSFTDDHASVLSENYDITGVDVLTPDGKLVETVNSGLSNKVVVRVPVDTGVLRIRRNGQKTVAWKFVSKK